MTTYRLNPAAGTDGTGTTVNPWNTLVGKSALAEGDTLLIDSGTTYAGNFPTGFAGANSLTIAEYGSGDRPIIDMGVEVTPTPSGTAGIWSYAYASNVGGNVSVDGAPMYFVPWDTDIATTAPSMGDDTFSIDPTNSILYVKPAGGTISGKTFKASSYINGMGYAGSHRKTVRNLEFRQASKHGFVHVASYAVTVENCIARHCGGWRDPSATTYYGNGFEFGNDCIDILVNRSEAYDIFDSPFTSQGYSSQLSALSARNHEYNDCRAERYGFAAFEIVTLSPWQTLNGVWINRPYARDGGNSASWSGDRNGKGDALAVYSGAGAKGGPQRIYCESPDFERQKYGARALFTTWPVRINGGRIVGSETAWAMTEQSGSPSAARAILAVSSDTVTDGAVNLVGGYTDSLVRY